MNGYCLIYGLLKIQKILFKIKLLDFLILDITF